MSAADVGLTLVAVLWLVGPGLLLLVAGGARGWILATAPAVSFGLVAAASMWMSVIGVRWNPLTFGTACVLAAGSAAIARRIWGRREVPHAIDPVDASEALHGTDPSHDRSSSKWLSGDLAVVAAIISAGAIGIAVFLGATNGLGDVHQDWDAVFHGNAIRAIVDFDDAGPDVLREVNNYEDEDYYYPNAFHALGAIVTNDGAVGIARVLGVLTMLIPGVAGLALAGFVRSYRLRPAVAACAVVLLAAFSAFPYDVLSRGPLLPYAYGLALVPAFLVLFRRALDRRVAIDYVTCALAAVGLLALQPSTAIIAALYVVALLVDRVRRGLNVRPDLVAVGIVAGCAVVLCWGHVVGSLSSAGAAEVDWLADLTPGHALGDLVLLNHWRQFPQWWLVLPIAIGVATIRQLRRVWWWVLASSIFALLFVAAASYEGRWVAVLTRPWWNDRWRFIAAVIPALALLAGQGVAFTGEWLGGFADRLTRGRVGQRALRFAGPLAVLLVVALGSGGLYGSDNADRLAIAYGDGRTVSAVEEQAFARLAELVDDGQRVMNDPRDGSPWMWSLADVRPMFGHVYNPMEYEALSEGQHALLERFNQIDTDPEIQALVDRYDIGYVFLGSGYLRPGWTRAEGLENLDAVESLELVETIGDNRIYRVVS